MAVKRSKSRGRNLQRTETQAQLQVSRYVQGERGRTNGREHLSAVSASKPTLRRREPNSNIRLMPKPLVAIPLDDLL